MKKLVSIVLVVSLVGFMACNKKSSVSGDQLYGVKSAIIHYQPVDMMGMKMTRSVYFDDYGQKEVQEVITEGSMPGMTGTVKVHQIDIRVGNIAYSYQLENNVPGRDSLKKEAIKVTISPEDMKQLSIFSADFKKKFNYKEEGSETIAGVSGTKFSICPDSTNPNNRISAVHYKNIPVKLPMGQGMNLIAEKIELDADIPATKFKVPAEYKITEQTMPQMPVSPQQSK